jgi:hypothetical protein
VPESTIIAFEIYILSQIQPEIWELPFYCRHLGFPLNGMSDNVGDSTVEKFDPINIGVAAGILFLSALELEIHLGGILPPLDNQRKYFILDIRRVNCDGPQCKIEFS